MRPVMSLLLILIFIIDVSIHTQSGIMCWKRSFSSGLPPPFQQPSFECIPGNSARRFLFFSFFFLVALSSSFSFFSFFLLHRLLLLYMILFRSCVWPGSFNSIAYTCILNIFENIVCLVVMQLIIKGDIFFIAAADAMLEPAALISVIEYNVSIYMESLVA